MISKTESKFGFSVTDAGDQWNLITSTNSFKKLIFESLSVCSLLHGTAYSYSAYSFPIRRHFLSSANTLT